MKLLQQLLSKSSILSASIALGLGVLGSCPQIAQAEGSKDLYLSGTGNRANLEWRTDITGGLVYRRTLLHVYANAGEYILMGSSAVGVTGANAQKGDIFVYNPNLVSGSIGSETFPGTPSFKCSTLVGRGVITSRTMESAGAQNITGTGNLTGYKPCYYKAPFNGVYEVVVMGPQGFSASGDGGPTGEVALTSTTNFSSTQGTSVAAWDVTVRSGSTDALAQASTVDIRGRLFSYYLALFTAGNGRPVYSTFYPVTLDGYIYKTDMRGTDPNGYLVYGNEVGFFNSDGKTPLYHDLMTGNGSLASIQGGATLARPQFPTFFNYPPDFNTLSYIQKFDRFGFSLGTGITNSPIPPGVTNPNFTGSLTGNSSKVGNGGTFAFNTNVVGNYEIVIKGSGSTDYDPTNPKNRVLRGYISSPGSQTVTWDGKDNNGAFFPVGVNYPYTIRIKAGEYHFPLLDAENNFYGGPTITLVNQPTSYPSDLPGFGSTTGFYDDRAYKTLNGTIVDSTRTQANIDANAALCGGSPPSTVFSNQVTGFLTTSNQRTFGASTGGNTNAPCTGSFGDTKGMDQWTYFPSSAATNVLNIVSPDLGITKTHSDPLRKGGTGVYTIIVPNTGTGSTDGTTVTVSDTLPTGLTPTTATGTGWTCTVVGQTVTCTRSDVLATGASYPAITVNLTVSASAAAQVTNTATVSGGGDTTPVNNTVNDVTNISTPPDLTITKTHTGNFNQGDTGKTYTITVNNAASTTATTGTITVTDTVPTGLTPTAATGTGWTCSISGQTVTCTSTTAIASGAASSPITLTVNVAKDASPSVINPATVSGGGDANSSNNTANDPTTINPKPDLTITKSHLGDFNKNQNGTYIITVKNIGSAATSGTVTVTDTLPTSDFSFISGTGTNWTCSSAGSPVVVTCTNSTAIAAGASSTITLVVKASSNHNPAVNNNVTVSGGGEIDSTNNSAIDPTIVKNTVAPDLLITKTHTGNFNQGQTGATYTISVKNYGDGGVTAGNTTTVTDTLPTGLTPTAATGAGWSCSISGQTVTCTRTDAIAAASNISSPTSFAGASNADITVTVNVAKTAPSSLINPATVSTAPSETNTANNSISDPTTINQLPDLTISKSHTPTNFKQGSTGTYNITVTNSGSVATTAGQLVTVVDTLPANFTFVNSSGFTINGWTCTPNSPTTGKLSCTRSDTLAVGASYPLITFDVNVGASATSGTNNATVTYATTESDTTNNSATDPTTVNLVPDLTIAKTHSGNFNKGGTGSYNLTVTNSGGAVTDGTAVTVTDTLNSNLTAVSATGTGWSCSIAGQVVTCTRNDALAVSASYPALTINVNVSQGAVAGSNITNTGIVANFSGGETNNSNNTSSTDTVTVAGVADLTIAKAGPASFTQSGTGAYTLTVTNSGTVATDGSTITVTDTIPPDLTATSVSGTGWSCTIGGVVTCTRSDVLAAGSSYPAITINVKVSANPGSSVTNNVTVAGGGETNTTNNTATKVSSVTLLPDLTLSKTHTGTFSQGGTGTYLLTVENIGSGSTTSNFSITDTLPAGLTFVTPTSGSGTNWSCGSPSGQNITCNYSGVLAPSGTTYLGNPEPAPPLSLFVNIAANATLSLLNTASVTGGGETNTTNNGANDLTTITPTGPVPDLIINKTYSSAFTRNSVGTYTLKVRNIGNGSTDGTTVTVTDTLPNQLTPTSTNFTINGWTCSSSGQVVTCTRSDVLGAGASYPDITLNVNVAANAPASVLNSAAVSGGGDSDPTNNNDSTLTFIDYPDLTIVKSHSGSFGKGATGTYTLKVTNIGKAATDNSTVTVTDTLPADLIAPITASGTGWSCNVTGNAITCTRPGGNLAINASYPDITITAKVSATAPSSITNTAIIQNGSGGEVEYSNNSSTDPTDITTLPDLIISKSHTGNFNLGGTGSYNLIVTNSGGSATSGTITVTDNLPTGFAPTSASGTGWTCSISGQTVTCTSSTSLGINGNANPITINVSVASNAPANTTNTAIVAGGGEVNTNNNSANDPTIINYPDLTIAKTHSGNFTQGVNSTGVGTDPTYSITVTNSGGAAIPSGSTITVVDTLPTGLTLYNSSAFTVNNWSCTPNSPSTGKITCTRSGTNSALAVATSYPTIDFKVNIANNAPPSVDNTAVVSTSGIESNPNNNTAIDSTAITLLPVGSPSVLLIKRITAINGVPVTGFVSDGRTTVENDNWPSPTSTYLRGQTAINNIKPGDVVEYTIYFLSNGTKDVTNVTICDLVPVNTTFAPSSFSSDKGIALGYNTTALANPDSPNILLTNMASDDRGEFYPAGMQPPTSCKKADSSNPPNYTQMTLGDNTNGLVIVNVAKTPTSTFPNIPVSSIPKATGPGTPFGSYGFIRFRATVK